MTEPFIGEIRAFGFDFAPRGWASCAGQLLPINQNQALFSLLGTQYGGDGRITFALPDFQGRVPVGTGQGAGLSPYSQGEQGGAEAVTLQADQLPSHTHQAMAAHAATSKRPAGNVPARGALPAFGPTADQPMSAAMIGSTGGGAPHENRQPYLAVNWCIAIEGIFPSRP